MFKELLLKKMLASKLSHLPKDEQERLISAIAKNPKFFQDIALEIKNRTDAGEGQMEATMSVMRAHENDLRALFDQK